MKVRLFYLVPVLALLNACTSNLDQLHKANPMGGSYTERLAKTYLNHADNSSKNMHYSIADSLAKKGLRASGGETIFVYSLGSWDIPAKDLQELSHARQQLREAYKKGSHLKHPEKMAEAQVSFDSWVLHKHRRAHEEASQDRERTLNALKEISPSCTHS